jgi:hypothetical protein
VTFFEAEGLIGVDDTVVVAARSAYPEYLRTAAYICQANRSIRRVSSMAFYSGKQIRREVPRVLAHYQEVEMSEENARRCESSDDQLGHKLASVIRSRLATQAPDLFNDIYLLTSRDDDETVILPGAIPHEGRTAWTQNQRYTTVDRLKTAVSTADLA